MSCSESHAYMTFWYVPFGSAGIAPQEVENSCKKSKSVYVLLIRVRIVLGGSNTYIMLSCWCYTRSFTCLSGNVVLKRVRSVLLDESLLC